MSQETIFKATYSSVPVYEMPCKGVAVMKRRSDNWLNATQILKVAGFDKPQRTRVLEREVQKGTHEKVQGGYGKYQGTWVPPERGADLAKQYGVDNLLQAIFDYVPPLNGSPPPAPKHVTAAPKGPRQSKNQRNAATPAVAAAVPSPLTSAPASPLYQQPMAPLSMSNSMMAAPPRPSRAARNDHPVYVDSQLSKVEQYDERELSPGPSEPGSSASRTPSPLGSEFPSEYDGMPQQMYNQAGGQRKNNKRKHEQADLEDGMGDGRSGGPAVYARMILDYFVSESAQIPSFLISPPGDFDPNVVIDDDGHTALHWACAMGRIRIVKLLLTAGADIFRANAMGQTALMRSVMFTNNFDLRKFPELFELLHRSTINIDRNDRTVFHYVIDIALQKQKAHAARYYLEVILDRLKEYPREVADILNFQDEEGETALTLAARARSKNLVRTLLNHGADAKIANRDGKSAEDYILEDERFKNTNDQPVLDLAGVDMGMLGAPGGLVMEQPTEVLGMEQVQPSPVYAQMQQQAVQPLGVPQANGYYSAAYPGMQAIQGQLHYSETGQRLSTQVIPHINSQLEALAATFDSELEDKEKDIAQAHALLANIQAEAVDSQRLAGMLQTQANAYEECQEKETKLQEELKDRMGKRFRLGWEKYVRDEEDRQKAFVTISKPLANDQNGLHTVSINAQSGPPPADIQAIFSSLPANGSEALVSSVRSSTEQLAKLKIKRRELCETFINLQAEVGAGDGKINEYRKLIALGCGIKADEVDAEFVKTVLDQLDDGEEA